MDQTITLYVALCASERAAKRHVELTDHWAQVVEGESIDGVVNEGPAVVSTDPTIGTTTRTYEVDVSELEYVQGALI